MRVKIMILLWLAFIGMGSYGQDIAKGAIVINGQKFTIRFVNIDKHSYVSLADLSRLLPYVFSLSKKGEIVVNPVVINPALLKNLLNSLAAPLPPSPPSVTAPAPSGSVIESRIDGEFEGWSGNTIFKLKNGQIWKQDQYAYTYSYAYDPSVIIYDTSTGWVMSVESLSEVVHVKRIY